MRSQGNTAQRLCGIASDFSADCVQKIATRLIHLLCMKPIPGTPDGFNILGV